MFNKKDFKFSADCKALEGAIKLVSSVVTLQGQFFLAGYKKALVVIGLSNDSFALVSVANSDVSAEGSVFAFSAEHLPGLIKNRAVMDFSYSGNKCAFKQVKGKYSGDVPTIAVTDDQLSQIDARMSDKTTGASLSSDTLSAIKTGLACTGIKDVYQNTQLVSYVALDKGRLSVSSFDSQHFGLYRQKLEDASKFKAAILSSHFNLINSIANGGDVKISVASTGLKASGKGFLLSLPATQADDKHHDMVAEFVKSLPKASYECEVDVEALSSLASNLFTLYNTNANFNFTCDPKQVSVSFKTSSGSAEDSAPVKGVGKAKFGVDPRLFIDILTLSKSCSDVKLTSSGQVVSLTGKANGASVFLASSRTE